MWDEAIRHGGGRPVRCAVGGGSWCFRRCRLPPVPDDDHDDRCGYDDDIDHYLSVQHHYDVAYQLHEHGYVHDVDLDHYSGDDDIDIDDDHLDEHFPAPDDDDDFHALVDDDDFHALVVNLIDHGPGIYDYPQDSDNDDSALHYVDELDVDDVSADADRRVPDAGL